MSVPLLPTVGLARQPWRGGGTGERSEEVTGRTADPFLRVTARAGLARQSDRRATVGSAAGEGAASDDRPSSRRRGPPATATARR